MIGFLRRMFGVKESPQFELPDVNPFADLYPAVKITRPEIPVAEKRESILDELLDKVDD